MRILSQIKLIKNTRAAALQIMAQNLNQLKAAVLQPPTMGIKGAYSRQAKAKQEQKQRAILDQLDG